MANPPGADRLDESVLTLDELAALSLDYLCIADLRTATFQWLSPNWASLLGWPLEELTRGSFLRYIHPDDLGGTRSQVDNLQQGSTVDRFVNRYVSRDGQVRWLEWNSMPYGAGRTFAVARDVTGSMHRQRQAAERAQMLELASEVGRLGYWRLDLVSSQLWWSNEVFRIHGRDLDRGGPTLADALAYYHPDDRGRVGQVLQSAVEKRRGFDFELRIVREDGVMRQVVARGRVECGPTGAATTLLGTFQDVTDERQKEAQLRRSERLVSLGTLAAGVAHEVNNPLTYVIGNLSMLVEELPEGELRQMAKDAAHGADHVRRIVDGLRSFSRVREGHEREVLALEEVLEAAVRLSAHQIRHRAELVQEWGALPTVLGDRAPLVQVFSNLLINAAQAVSSDRRGRIALRAFAEGTDVVVDVDDDGPGIPEDVRERIFDPFFTTKNVGDGTGLGLSICIGTVETHGGILRLVESRPGHTRFRVRMPAHGIATDPRITPLRAERHPGPRSSPAIVMVIDDDPQVASLVTRALTGHDVRAYVRAEEALAALEGGLRPDVMLCDLMMPGMSGWHVHEVLAERYPEMVERAVYITGGAFVPEAERFLDGTDPAQRLLKPFLPSQLRDVVSAVLARSA